MRSFVKRAVVTLLGSDPMLAARLHHLQASRAVTVLNLHRIDDHRVSAYEAIQPAQFDALVAWLKERFTIVTFGELEQAPEGRPLLILSFDDGYKDFIEYASPILDRHHVRANQNVIPACVESGLPPINVLIQDFIGQAPAALLREVPLPGLPSGADPESRVRSGLQASTALKMCPIAEQKAALSRLQSDFARFDDFTPTPLMTRREIREIGGIHEIGAHSFEHATMTAETDAYLADDAQRCRQWHADCLGATATVYAFPNGAAAPRHVDIVRAAGYAHVLLVGEKFTTRDAQVHPRISVYGSTQKELRFRSTGALPAPRRSSAA